MSHPSVAIVKERLARHPGVPYIYVLRRPDGVECWGGVGTPFYVGVGTPNTRLFAHEAHAHKIKLDTSGRERDHLKKSTIRAIHAAGGQVVYSIDSFWPDGRYGNAALREADLINAMGLLRDGSGILANRQRYEVAPSDRPQAYLDYVATLPTAATPAGWMAG